MRIISWNIERPQKDKKLGKNLFIMELIRGLNPDIIFLTETNSIIDFSSDYFTLQTTPLPEKHENNIYYKGENRVSIFSKYEFISKFETYDTYTSVCGEVATPFGNLILYGSIIGGFGIVGSKNMEYFKRDLDEQQKEIEKLIKKGNLCYSGDFNMAFSSDYYREGYPKKEVRKMTNFFKETHLVNTTGQNENCVIHIVLSENFVKGLNVKSQMIKIERAISDHNLVITDII